MVDQAKANSLAAWLGFSDYGTVLDNPGGKNIVLSTDGVGTKLLVAERFNKFDTVGIDLVAMCVNDLLCMGARPVAFLDYLATGALQLDKSKEILKGVLEGCRLAGCALVGGETAQLNPMFYRPSWFDLAGFVMGFQERSFPVRGIEPGSTLVGIPSSGLHSNGFTKIRESYSEWREDFLTPTRIYTKEILDNLEHIQACAHITGGGIHGNLPRILGKRDYSIHLPIQKYWKEIQKSTKLSKEEMENTFNCGWGMILVVKDPSLLKIKDAALLGKVYG